MNVTPASRSPFVRALLTLAKTGTLTAVLAAFAVLPAAAKSPLLFMGDFEEGVIKTEPAKWNISVNGDGTPSIVSEPTRAGKQALRNVLNWKSRKDYRSELRVQAPNPVWGEDAWYGFSIYYPPGTPVDSQEEIVAQWHSNPYGSPADAQDTVKNPPLALSVVNGTWALWRRWAADQPTTNENKRGKHDPDLGKVENGVWTDWVFRVRWHWLPERGQVQVWKNGFEMVNDSGGVGYHDVKAPYFKLGLYKWPWRSDKFSTTGPVITTRTIYHDEFRMAGQGASYDDVAPGGTARASGANAAVLLNDGFERTDLYQDKWWNRSGNENGAIVSEIAREGSASARFRVAHTVDGDYRSEISAGDGNPAERHATVGEECWYGVSIMPVAELKPTPMAEIVFQFHSSPDVHLGETWESGLNPPVALACDGTKWTLTVRGDDKPVTVKPNYSFKMPTVDLGAAEPGQWTDWVFNIKWNFDGNGHLRVWKNGKLAYSGKHPNCYNDKVGPYLKMGVYAFAMRTKDKAKRPQNVGDRVYYHDSVRIAKGAGGPERVSPPDVRF
jgi:hypothetical protein